MIRSDLALAALASAAVPGMKPVAVAAVVQDDETDHQQAVVEDATGRRWLVRSPLTPVAGARLRRGDDLVRQLSRHVPFKVPAPVGYASVGQDGHAVVYPHVEGMPLDLAHLPPGPGLASALGRTVAAVHNIPRGVFEEQDLPVFDNAGCRQRLIAEVDRAAETGRVPTGLLARWEEAFDAAPLWQFATTPVHGGFRGSSVLVAFADEDASSGRVVAVTDWEEAMVADPATDLAELYASASAAAWESVLDAYALARAQRPDPYLHARARLIAETRRLRGLAHAVTEQDEQATRRIVEALRRMDRLTEDDDSLVPVTARGAGAVASPSTGDVPVTAPSDAVDEATGSAAAVSPAPHAGWAVPGTRQTPEVDEDATAEVPVDVALAGLRGAGDEGSEGDPAAEVEDAEGDPAAGVEDAPDLSAAGEATAEDIGPGDQTSGQVAPGAEPSDDEPDAGVEVVDPREAASVELAAAPGQPEAAAPDEGAVTVSEQEAGQERAVDQEPDTDLEVFAHRDADADEDPTVVEGSEANEQVVEAAIEETGNGSGDEVAGPVAEDDLADDQQERLHELYGMPSPDRDDR